MLFRLSRNWRRCPCAIVCALAFALLIRVSAQETASEHTDLGNIQRIVDELKGRLGLPATVNVRVAVVTTNPLLASVTPVQGLQGAFLLSLEEGFAGALNDDELKAALAHELGHVWIFTHFPYLQTEELANEIAMRVVNRESLAPVYAKVEARMTTMNLTAPASRLSSPGR